MQWFPLALCALTPSVFAGTWTVAKTSGPGVDFTSIQAAIDAAVDGDEILIRPGGYPEQLHIDGKALVLHAEIGVTVNVTGSSAQPAPAFLIENLAANQTVELREFSIVRISGVHGPSLVLEDNQGRVQVQNVFVDTYDGNALQVERCAEVVLVGSMFQSNLPFLDSQGLIAASNGMTLREGSHVLALNTSARGSHGHPLGAPANQLVVGGDGAFVEDSSLRQVGGTLSGGTGNSVTLAGCLTAASGGAGLHVAQTGASAPEVTLRDVAVFAGGSAFSSGVCAPLPPTTQALEGLASLVQSEPGEARLLALIGNPSFAGTADAEVLGGANDFFLVFASGASVSPTPLPGLVGDVMIDLASAKLVRTGQLNIAGMASFETQVVPGPSGTFHLQAMTVDTNGAPWLTNAIALRLP